MFYCFVILLVVGFTGGQAADGRRYAYNPPMDDGGDPRTLYCCWPQQFRAKLLTQGGYPAHVPGVAQIDRTLYYDLEHQRWALVFYVEFFHGENMQSIWLEDHDKGRIVQVRGNKCDYRPIDTDAKMRKVCATDASRHVERARMGARDEMLAYDVYEWTERASAMGNVTYSVAMQLQTCLPLMETGWWMERAPRDKMYQVSQSIDFTDIEVTTDVSAFLDSVYERYDCQPAGKEDPRKMQRWVPEPPQQYLQARLRHVLPEEIEAEDKWRAEQEEKRKQEEAAKREE